MIRSKFVVTSIAGVAILYFTQFAFGMTTPTRVNNTTGTDRVSLAHKEELASSNEWLETVKSGRFDRALHRIIR